jgi:hypothetical protein
MSMPEPTGKLYWNDVPEWEVVRKKEENVWDTK